MTAASAFSASRKRTRSPDWLNFEAGALSKALTMGRAAPALVDIDPADVTGPLANVQAVRLTEEDIHGLVRSINYRMPDTSRALASSVRFQAMVARSGGATGGDTGDRS